MLFTLKYLSRIVLSGEAFVHVPKPPSASQAQYHHHLTTACQTPAALFSQPSGGFPPLVYLYRTCAHCYGPGRTASPAPWGVGQETTGPPAPPHPTHPYCSLLTQFALPVVLIAFLPPVLSPGSPGRLAGVRFSFAPLRKPNITTTSPPLARPPQPSSRSPAVVFRHFSICIEAN
jgi:hypothetical protein